MGKSNNNCSNMNFHCMPLSFSQCCSTQTTFIDSTQLTQLINLINGLSRLINSFLSNPTEENKQELINKFTQLLNLLNTLSPSPELTYVKQLIHGVLNTLQTTPVNLGNLQSMLQQLYSALPSLLFTLMVDSAVLQTLLNLLTQLVGSTPGAGATGPTGATGTFAGVQTFDPANAPTYQPGQVVIFDGSSYVINEPNPQGIPGTSPDYTLIASGGATGPTGATGTNLTSFAEFTQITNQSGGVGTKINMTPVSGFPIGADITFSAGNIILSPGYYYAQYNSFLDPNATSGSTGVTLQLNGTNILGALSSVVDSTNQVGFPAAGGAIFRVTTSGSILTLVIVVQTANSVQNTGLTVIKVG
ncbi:collagen-like repeat preface domain-containing protein [Bacillus cereus]|uniref:collagen-like repeat preface domain-containing protein n=1 Tax=Bacillus cereus TaxID=1396 RepID=UPI002852A743|nr:collagen-like repeat preface domain-containing protein [Bacillus cereus]